jgi:hypothetical protein
VTVSRPLPGRTIRPFAHFMFFANAYAKNDTKIPPLQLDPVPAQMILSEDPGQLMTFRF